MTAILARSDIGFYENYWGGNGSWHIARGDLSFTN